MPRGARQRCRLPTKIKGLKVDSEVTGTFLDLGRFAVFADVGEGERSGLPRWATVWIEKAELLMAYVWTADGVNVNVCQGCEGRQRDGQEIVHVSSLA